MPFALLACPGGLGQLKQGRPLFRLLPDFLSAAAIPWLEPRVLEQLEIGNLPGLLWEFPLLPLQLTNMPTNKLNKKIHQTAKALRESGARILGLEQRLRTLAPAFQAQGLSVATGVTAATLAALNLALQLCPVPRQHCRVLVINPVGSAGQAAARVLARHVRYLTLMGNYLPSLERLARRILLETGTASVIVRSEPSFYSAADLIFDFSGQSLAAQTLKPGVVIWQPLGPPFPPTPEIVYIREAVMGTGLDLPLEVGLAPGVIRADSAEALLMTAAARAPWPRSMFDLTPDRLLFGARLIQELGLTIEGYQGSCSKSLNYLTNPIREFIIC